jgi:hypothetical protein
MEQKSGRTQKTPFSVSEIANKYQFGAKTINLLGAKLKVVPRPFVNLLSHRIVVLSTCYLIVLLFCQLAISSYCCFVNLQFYQLVIYDEMAS